MEIGKIQQWALTLLQDNCDCHVKYKLGAQHSHEDALKCTLLGEFPTSLPVPAKTVHIIKFLFNIPVHSGSLIFCSKMDTVLYKSLALLPSGLPDVVDEELHSFCTQKRARES